MVRKSDRIGYAMHKPFIFSSLEELQTLLLIPISISVSLILSFRPTYFRPGHAIQTAPKPFKTFQNSRGKNAPLQPCGRHRCCEDTVRPRALR